VTRQKVSANQNARIIVEASLARELAVISTQFALLNCGMGKFFPDPDLFLPGNQRAAIKIRREKVLARRPSDAKR
jgi:hypothetical protein